MQASYVNNTPRRFYQLFLGLLRQYRSSILLYSAILFGIYTVPTLISFFGETDFFKYWSVTAGHNFNEFSFVMFIIYIMVVPISLGTKHFGYMHSKRAVDLYHALPVKRRELYLAQTAVGSIGLAVPVLINFGIILCLQVMSGNAMFTGTAIANMLLWLVAGYAVFAITGFCAVNVGSGLDTALFTMALNGAPAAIFMLNQAVKESLLYGYWFDDRAAIWASRLSPIPTMIIREMSMGYTEGEYLNTGITMLVWLVIAALITAVAPVLYKRRKSEMAEVVGNFGPAQIAIRAMIYYLGAVVFALAFCGIFYYGSAYNEHIYFVIGAAVGALVTGIIGEMLLTRSPKMAFKRLPIILGVTVLAAAGSLLYTNGGFGYETYVPDPNSVASVQIDFSDGYSYLNGNRNQYNQTYTNPAIIGLVTDIHQAQVDAYKADLDYDDYYYYNYYRSGYFNVTYSMKNGQQVSRRYYDAYDEAVEQMIRLSMEPAYVEQRSEFFYIEPSEIGVVSLSSVLQDNTEDLMLTTPQKTGLLEAIRADLLSRDADIMLTGAEAVGFIEVQVSYPIDNNTYDRYGNAYGYDEYGDITWENSARAELLPSRTHYTDLLYFTIYTGDTETLAFLEANDLLRFVTADFSRVIGLWLIDSDYAYYKYYSDGLLSELHASIGSDINSMVMDYLEDSQSEDYYPYGYSGMIPVDVARMDELRALAQSTAMPNRDTLLLAFRTESSVARTGYLYIDRASLPADLEKALEEAASYDYYDEYYGGYYKEETEPAAEEDMEGTPQIENSVVPMGSRIYLY